MFARSISSAHVSIPNPTLQEAVASSSHHSSNVNPSHSLSESHIPASAPSVGPSFFSKEQIARLREEMSYIMENEGNGDSEEEENIVDDALFEEEDREDGDEIADVQTESVVTTDMGSIGADEMTGAGADAGGVLFEYLKSLIDNIKKDITGIGQPAIYRNGSFWHRPRDPIFALEASRMTSSGINPRELYHRDVFVWLLGLPTRLPGEPDILHCPTCKSGRGQHHQLSRKGLLIYGVDCFNTAYKYYRL